MKHCYTGYREDYSEVHCLLIPVFRGLISQVGRYCSDVKGQGLVWQGQGHGQGLELQGQGRGLTSLAGAVICKLK